MRARSGARARPGGTASVEAARRARRSERGARREHLHGNGIGRLEEPGEGVQHGRLAGPARPDEGGEGAGRGHQGVGQHGGAPGAGGAVDEPGGALDHERRSLQERGSPRPRAVVARPWRHEGRVDRDRLGRPRARYPDAHRQQAVPLRRERLAHGPVGDDPAVGGEHDEPVDQVDPRTEHVLHHDQRRRGMARGWFRGVRHRPLGIPGPRSAPRRRRAPPAPRPGRASPSARPGAPPTGRAPGSPRARAAGSARRTARRSGCRATGRPGRRPRAPRRPRPPWRHAASARSPGRTPRRARRRPRRPRHRVPAAPARPHRDACRVPPRRPSRLR